MFSSRKGSEGGKSSRHPDDSPSPVLAALHLEQSFLFQRRIASGPDIGAAPGVNNGPGTDLESKIDKVFDMEPVYECLSEAAAGSKSNRKSDSGSNYEYLPEQLRGAGLGPYRNPESSLHYEYLHWPKKDLDLGSNYETIPGAGGSTSYADPVDYQHSQIYDNLADYADADVSSRITMPLGNMFCSRCGEGFESQEKIVNSKGGLWHPHCFVCAQCFRPFPGGIFYEFEGRKYCEHDFHVLFAPCCGKCGEFVIGRVIKAMNANWHPKCFRCADCDKELADLGFIRNQGRALCHECHAKAKAVGQGKHVCHKCHGIIDDKPLRYRNEVYHPYHFNCTSCGTELNSDAREVKSRPGYTANDLNELYCLRCHDKMGVPICGACRRPIEERVVTALGKHWHVEHFVCARCEKPFLGHRHYEKKGLAYCETHYHQLFGNLCFVCNQVIAGDVFTALNKAWCVHHFACSVCDQKLNQKTKFYELDLKPTCKRCYDKFPAEMRHRLRKAFKNTPKKA